MKLLLGDCLDRLKELPDNSVDSIITDPPYGLSFMQQKWDYDVPSVEIWKECLRVLKPGGHLLSFGGSRTYHRMAVNVEDGGFEIRDQIQWIYGSGFPKSHNIGKAVDKKLGNEPTIKGYVPRYPEGTRGEKKTGDSSWFGGNGFEEQPGMKPVYEIKNEWEGWGTALKPAHEPIVMARKPFKGTIVDNVLKHGTGGINIDESRITYQQEENINFDRPRVREKKDDWVYGLGTKWDDPSVKEYNQEGRFPANIILSEEAAENLDQHQKDTSRYFYIVKPSKKEKDFGMMGEEKKVFTPYDEGYKNTTNGTTEIQYERNTKRKNNHPTIKPIKLMEYLIKMITPKGGVVLDPFMGSGTTGIAALTNGYDFIGIEMEEEYMDIAKQRIDAWTNNIQTKLEI